MTVVRPAARVTVSHSDPCSVPWMRQPYEPNQSAGPPWTTEGKIIAGAPDGYRDGIFFVADWTGAIVIDIDRRCALRQHHPRLF